MRFSRQEYWSGLPFPSPGDLPNPGIEPRSPSLQEDSSLSDPPGKLQRHISIHQICLLNHLTHCQKYLVNSDSSPILIQGERKKKQMIKNLGINNIWIFALYRWRFNWLFSSPILVPWPGIKLRSWAMKAWNSNHWTTREFLPQGSRNSFFYIPH